MRRMGSRRVESHALGEMGAAPALLAHLWLRTFAAGPLEGVWNSRLAVRGQDAACGRPGDPGLKDGDRVVDFVRGLGERTDSRSAGITVRSAVGLPDSPGPPRSEPALSHDDRGFGNVAGGYAPGRT